jgi:hypothetical protein
MLKKMIQTVALCSVAATAPGQGSYPANLVSRFDLDVAAFQSEWQPLPQYDFIRTWYDGTGFQVAMSDQKPWSSVGWIYSPTFNVPPRYDDQDGNLTTVTVHFTFTANYTGQAPEMRVRVHTRDMVQYSVSSVTPARFNALRSAGAGTVTVNFDRRHLTQQTPMWMFVDLISVTSQGNADPNFHFRVNRVEVANYEPQRWKVTSRISASYLESDGDVAIYTGGNLARRQIFQDSDAYAVDGAFAIVMRDGNLWAYGGDNNFAPRQLVSNRTVVSAGVSEEHVVWLESDRDVWYRNLLTGVERRIGNGRNYLGVVPQGSGSFVVIEVINASTNQRAFWMYDALKGVTALERLPGDSQGVFTNVGATGLVPRKSLDGGSPESYHALSGAWFLVD